MELKLFVSYQTNTIASFVSYWSWDTGCLSVLIIFDAMYSYIEFRIYSCTKCMNIYDMQLVARNTLDCYLNVFNIQNYKEKFANVR